MTAALIEVHDLHKRFAPGLSPRRLLRRRALPAHEALCGVDLTVLPGERIAILGPNGAGKTTLLKTVATLLLPTSGSVRVGGFDVERQGGQVRRLTGYVLADDRSFHWRLSARHNLEFFAALCGLHGAERRRRIDTLLGRLDLGGAADQRYGEFSTGMKQRLAIARALLAHPRVLLMDEPTRSVDPVHAAAVWRLVDDEIDGVDGCVVLVTHQVQEAVAACRRVAVLEAGRIVSDTSARAAASLTAGLDGFILQVRGLDTHALPSLRVLAGVRDLRLDTQPDGEQTLELWTADGELSLASFLSTLTSAGAVVCALQRATPLQGMLERLPHGGMVEAPA